jgi:hypothetical protein
MTETPESSEARKVVDELEEKIVDVDRARDQAGATEEASDQSDAVPGSPEPSA